MRRIWNMTADAGKGKSKQHLIKMFLLLNSLGRDRCGCSCHVERNRAYVIMEYGREHFGIGRIWYLSGRTDWRYRMYFTKRRP